MMRYGALRSYSRNTLPTRAYQTATILVPYETAECKFIQDKKDELLVSMKLYFEKELEKVVLESRLTNIKRELSEKCPTYVSKPGCC